MTTIKPIRNDKDLDAALARLEEIFEVVPGTPDADEREVLATLIEAYEDEHYPIDSPDPITAIEFEMDQRGLTRNDLVPIIGSRSKVSEVLSGKRDITMAMARALHHHLSIPAEVLLQKPGAALPDTPEGIDWNRFPLRAMANAGWIQNGRNLKDRAEELVSGLMERAGGREFAAQIHFRKNDDRRINAKTDEFALMAWCWQVMAMALEKGSNTDYKAGVVTEKFLRDVARQSAYEDGPRRARDFLVENGIEFVVLPHLPRTHLDGAAIRLPNGRPVIGMTLRYDRIDNFWFTLLHELAHIGLHLDRCEGETAFVDDHSLRTLIADDGSKESQSDQWAADALVPENVWRRSAVRRRPTAMSVLSLAQSLHVHPSIIAGRVRHERGNYRLLSQFVGTGEIRRQFGECLPKTRTSS